LEITIKTTKRWQAKLALEAEEWIFALNDFDEWLRSRIKYHDRDELEPVRETLHEYLRDRGLSLDQTMCDMDS
jgi:hypothetical protein